MAKEDNTPAIAPHDPEVNTTMKNMGKDDLLELLAGLLTRDLVVRIAMGVATPSDRNVARQLLRDAGIELTEKNKDATNLKEILGTVPFDVEDDEQHQAFRMPARSASIA